MSIVGSSKFSVSESSESSLYQIEQMWNDSMASSSYAEEDSGTTSISGDDTNAGEEAEASFMSAQNSSVEHGVALTVCWEGLFPGQDVSTEEVSNPSSIDGSGESGKEGLENVVVRAFPPKSPNCKYIRKAVREQRSSGSSNMDVCLWGTLDDHLLEKIIFRLPFKAFLVASLSLSKTWRLRNHSPSFQREVQNSSSSWESYCPVYMNSAKELVGYDSRSKSWHRLPSLQDGVAIPKAGAGSLICSTCPYLGRGVNSGETNIRVMNTVTKSWKMLPLRPQMHFPDFVHMDLDGNQAYKVIVGKLRRQFIPHKVSICVQIFDSKDKSWTTEVYRSIGRQIIRNLVESSFINGVLYTLVGSYSAGFMLISLDVKTKIWKKVLLRPQAMASDTGPGDQLLLPHPISLNNFFVCSGSHVMMTTNLEENERIVFFSAGGRRKNIVETLCVFRIDVKSGLTCEMSRAPNDLLGLVPEPVGFSRAVAHGDCLYISCTSSLSNESLSLVYNAQARQWYQVPPLPNKSLPFRDMTPIIYQPGLNPFQEI